MKSVVQSQSCSRFEKPLTNEYLPETRESREPKFSTNFNDRINQALKLGRPKRCISVRKMEDTKDVGLENKKKVREHPVLVKKLHEAHSAMTIFENIIKEMKEEESRQTEELHRVQRSKEELYEQLKAATHQVEDQTHWNAKILKEFELFKKSHDEEVYKLKKVNNKLENELRLSLKSSFDLTNFLNYVENRTSESLTNIMSDEPISRFDKHPFDVYNKSEAVNFEKIFKNVETLLGYYSGNVNEINNLNMERKSLQHSLDETKLQSHDNENAFNYKIQMIEAEKEKMRLMHEDQVYQNHSLRQSLADCKSRLDDLNKVIGQINIQRKYRVQTDADAEYTPLEIIDKVLNHDLVLKALHEKCKLLCNWVNNSQVMQCQKESLELPAQLQAFSNYAEVSYPNLVQAWAYLLSTINMRLNLNSNCLRTNQSVHQQHYNKESRECRNSDVQHQFNTSQYNGVQTVNNEVGQEEMPRDRAISPDMPEGVGAPFVAINNLNNVSNQNNNSNPFYSINLSYSQELLYANLSTQNLNIRDSVQSQDNSNLEYREKTETKELFNKYLYKKGKDAQTMLSPLRDSQEMSK